MKFTWYGKENAIIESMTPSTGTLRPDKESSKNWDNTENLYIEGDNLEVLKLLQKSYFGKVKMIYIDPPYNTGNDFVYKDNFRDDITSYKKITNQTTKANPEINGRYHTDWLNMMYPRLKLARSLLREDGVIFISIDDNEQVNLKRMCDEIFGEENILANLIWDLGTGTQAGHFTRGHEYILAYSKNKIKLNNFSGGDGFIEDRANKKISTKNPASKFTFKKGTKFDAPNGTEFLGEWGDSEKMRLISGRMICENGVLKEDVVIEAGWAMKNQMESWFNGNETYDTKGQKVIEFFFNKNGVLRYKKERAIINPSTMLKSKGSTKQGTDLLKDLLGNISDGFDYPKPLSLIDYIVGLCTKENDIVLDFFSGSSTTAHSVMKLNAEKNNKCKFIMVQLPEETDEKSEAYKAGFNNICEIGKERIRRAGDKIISENKDKEGIENLDIGFKVFKLKYNYGGENHSIMKDGIKVNIIKRPKDKPIYKFKVYGELYYLVKTSNDIIVFPYKSSIKGKAIASIFNIELCKDRDYMQLEYLYNMKLNEFNGEDFIHSQYVTSVILDNVYKTLND